MNAASDASYALAGACSVVFVLAACLRFGADRRWPLLARLSDDAFGVYVLHYAPVVWLQYALLGLRLAGSLKAALVLCGAIASCMAATSAARSLRRIGRQRGRSLRWISGSVVGTVLTESGRTDSFGMSAGFIALSGNRFHTWV